MKEENPRVVREYVELVQDWARRHTDDAWDMRHLARALEEVAARLRRKANGL